MTRIEIWEQLTEIFRDVFNDDAITIDTNTSEKDIEKWDFLNHIKLIMEVQEKWDLDIDAEQVDRLKNVGSFVDLIFSHIQEQAVIS